MGSRAPARVGRPGDVVRGRAADPGDRGRGRLAGDGVCGIDREIAEGAYGTPPSGETTLVIGHESQGEVLEAPVGSGFAPGDLVVGIVRRPDPMPCPACAAGEWDMCRNDGFGERGIVRLHRYGSQQWRVEPNLAVPILPRLRELGVLLEPASVQAKAWDQVDQISRRAFFLRRRALVTGAGPIGMMACLLGVQHGDELHVVDLSLAGPKPDPVEDLGAHYHAGDAVDVDVVIGCTGLGSVGRSARRPGP